MLKWQSGPGKVIQLVMDGVIIPVLNAEIAAEYRAVLSRPKFSLTDDIIETIINSIESLGVFTDSDNIDIELPDPKDLIFYQVVTEERKDKDAYLVTGNIKHFPNEPFIVIPRRMIDIISEDLGDAYY